MWKNPTNHVNACTSYQQLHACFHSTVNPGFFPCHKICENEGNVWLTIICLGHFLQFKKFFILIFSKNTGHIFFVLHKKAKIWSLQKLLYIRHDFLFHTSNDLKSSLIRHMVGKHKQEWLWVSDNVIQNTCTCFGSVDYTRYNNNS